MLLDCLKKKQGVGETVTETTCQHSCKQAISGMLTSSRAQRQAVRLKMEGSATNVCWAWRGLYGAIKRLSCYPHQRRPALYC
ncbi:hypothetical protein E2C01_065709 [Portunus trituberculatus]|uniref:Uncharacterized protein n=1 Tax=Portunus trituberculatus TaxID=210409 RepID=A0A5B7HJL1_PORTR|nr:hypothetical protein [Portunus trituberculatus]